MGKCDPLPVISLSCCNNPVRYLLSLSPFSGEKTEAPLFGDVLQGAWLGMPEPNLAASFPGLPFGTGASVPSNSHSSFSALCFVSTCMGISNKTLCFSMSPLNPVGGPHWFPNDCFDSIIVGEVGKDENSSLTDHHLAFFYKNR